MQNMLDPAPPTDVFEECMTSDGIEFKKYSAGGCVFYTIAHETDKQVQEL